MPIKSNPVEYETAAEAKAASDGLHDFTAEERAMFIASLEAAQRRIQSGDFEPFDKSMFMERLIEIFRLRKYAHNT